MGFRYVFLGVKACELPTIWAFDCFHCLKNPLVSIDGYKTNKKTKKWNSGQHIPDVLSACWTISWYSHVIGRTQNTVKQCEKIHFSNWNTMNFICLPGNLQPLPYLYIYICVCVSLLDLIKPPYFVGWITFFKVKSKKSQRNQDIGGF